MAFAAESAATIRDRALANWRARYLARGEDLDITEGSDAYNEIDALAMEFEGLGLGAQEAAHRVLLRYATGQDLDAFAEDDGTARLSATTARRVIRVTGPVSATTPTGGATLATPGGLRYTPLDSSTGAALTSIITDGDGVVDVTFECTTPGVTGNLVTGTVLTWSSAPTGFAATGSVVAGASSREGEDAESDTALRERLLERRKERPGAGNRADWREWARLVAGVGDVFVHCNAWPPSASASPPRTTITPSKLGCMTLLPVNPTPAADSYVQNADNTLGAGLDPSYARRPSADLCTHVGRYLDGTHDVNGLAVAEALQKQLYPGVMDRTNWEAVRAEPALLDVTVEIALPGGAGAFAFDGARTVSSGNATTMVLSSVSGIGIGTKLAFNFAATSGGMTENGPALIRGGWWLATVASVGGGAVTLTAALPAVPPAGTLVRADPGVWTDVRRVILQYFDAFGPAAPSGLGRSERFPPVSWGAQANVVPSRILVAVLGIAGLDDAAVTAPAAVSSPTLGRLAMPSVITVSRKVS